MKPQSSCGQYQPERIPVIAPAILHMADFPIYRTPLAVCERAQRLYRMGELEAAAILLAQETIQ
jgi:hypothetical protein